MLGSSPRFFTNLKIVKSNIVDIKQQLIDWLNNNYTEESIGQLIEEEITSGNWVSEEDIAENDDCFDEFDWYEQFGRGEAEDAVRDQIQTDALNYLKIQTPERYQQQCNEEIWETISSVFPKLDT